MKVVLDTNILVAALMSANGASRAVLRLAFEGKIVPLVGMALFKEYESLLARDYLFERGPLSRERRMLFLDDFLSLCKWVEIHFLWRPNLRDEQDSHVMELALAGQARCIVTHNLRDFAGGELLIPEVAICDPGNFLKNWEEKSWQH